MTTCPACGKSVETASNLPNCPACGAALPEGSTRVVADHGLDPALLKPGEAVGGYRIEGLIGQGGMGAVYRAVQASLNRHVALKILAPRFAEDPSFIQRFDREAAALAALSHPNIVAIIDRGVDQGRYFFVMEHVDGVNLRETLRKGPLLVDEALRLIPPLCDALEYAHGHGVHHRDIKPENLIVTRSGHVKIADFGLARLTRGDETDAPALTATETVMGTRDYMAPESRKSARSADHRADIYALGVVLYEMLTGSLPIGKFAPPSTRAGVDARLDAVVHRALDPDPERRYQRVSDLAREITHITGAGLRGQTELLPAGVGSRRRLAWAAAAGVLLLGALGWAAAWLRPAIKAQESVSLHAPFQILLQASVKEGMVDYRALKAREGELDAYLAMLSGKDPAGLDRAAQMAFWINAYNALALKRVLGRYPDLGSIQDIDRWDEIEDLAVAGRPFSLERIRSLLRKMGDPRIHFALVPAMASSPDLASEAYVEGRLEEQLAAASRRFLADPRKGLKASVEKRDFFLGKGEKLVLRLSPLFRKYREDFEDEKRTELGSVMRFLPPETQELLRAHPSPATGWFQEDWRLNGK